LFPQHSLSFGVGYAQIAREKIHPPIGMVLLAEGEDRQQQGE
jgi:hypothetical protein